MRDKGGLTLSLWGFYKSSLTDTLKRPKFINHLCSRHGFRFLSPWMSPHLQMEENFKWEGEHTFGEEGGIGLPQTKAGEDN